MRLRTLYHAYLPEPDTFAVSRSLQYVIADQFGFARVWLSDCHPRDDFWSHLLAKRQCSTQSRSESGSLAALIYECAEHLISSKMVARSSLINGGSKMALSTASCLQVHMRTLKCTCYR